MWSIVVTVWDLFGVTLVICLFGFIYKQYLDVSEQKTRMTQLEERVNQEKYEYDQTQMNIREREREARRKETMQQLTYGSGVLLDVIGNKSVKQFISDRTGIKIPDFITTSNNQTRQTSEIDTVMSMLTTAFLPRNNASEQHQNN